MKKVISLLLALVLCLSLCACGKSDATKAVEAQIAELTNVTYADKAKVEAAHNAYFSLTAEEMADVDNKEILWQAESAIEAEEQRLINEIVANNLTNKDPLEAIRKLRQFQSNQYAQTHISALGREILLSYVLKEGYTSDYVGNADPSEDYKAVAVNGYYFLVYKELETVQFVYTDSSTVNRLLKSQYSVDSRDHRLYIYEHGGTYNETEWIDEGWRYACYVNWDVSFNKNSDFDELHPDVKCNDLTIWPYTESQATLEEYSTMNVEGCIDKMDLCLRALDMPFTAWELFGFFNPASQSEFLGETTDTEEPTPEVICYPDTKFPAIESAIKNMNCEPTVTQEDLCVRYSYIEENVPVNNQDSDFHKFTERYKTEVLSQFEQVTYTHKLNDTMAINYYVWFDGAGHALMIESSYFSDDYYLEICILTEDHVQAYIDMLY